MSETILVTPDTRKAALAGLPGAARLAFALAENIRCGSLEVALPGGRRLLFRGPQAGPAASMTVKDYRFAWRTLRSGDIGVAESYLRGEWETPDLTGFLYLFCINREMMERVVAGSAIARWLQGLRHWLNRNTRRQARRNIHAHYDLGNAFYSAWLDPTMTYSSALFDAGSNDLTAAQLRKYQSLAQSIDLKREQTVLEIGCGWGGFAEFAARTYDARVVGLTISREQHDFARRRVFEAGLADRVEIRLQDYRDERGRYDRIASIEMLEAVGEQFWPAYFAQLRDRLKPGGAAGIQTITIQERFFDNYKREIDFIRRYVFPGGMLPTPSTLKSLGDRFGVPFRTERIFGEDYARTLAEWRERFRAAWPQITPLGFDERFRRLWEYYLAYCEAGFLSRNIDVRQMVFARGA
jgi:cyclopropane-fatty-acyl-phospholipid synthase